MRHVEVEKLLGGYATGILTEAERRRLFEAALAHQDLFDALADEEALRELLADPAARAQVLAALAPAPPKVVPFWRRPGVIGAAAGLIVATTAGLAVLRSPEPMPPAAKPEAAQAPAPAPSASAPASPEAKVTSPRAPKAVIPPKEEAVPRRAVAAPAVGNVSPALAASAPADPAPSASAQASAAAAVVDASATAPVPGEEARRRAQAEMRQMEARDQVSKQAEALGMARSTAVMEAMSPAPAPARRMAAKAAAPPTAGLYAAPVPAPVWTLEALPDGSTRVTVVASREARVVLLRRGASGVEVLKPGTAGNSEPWQFQLRLAPGDALDLYVMNSSVADPARLPETGPVDGFRARIHPPAKK